MEGRAESRFDVAGGTASCFMTSPLPVLLAMGSTVFSGWGMPERWTWEDGPGRWTMGLAPGSGRTLAGACGGSWM